MTTTIDQQIAAIIPLITGKEEKEALIEILEAIHASQEAQKLLNKRSYTTQALNQTQKAVSTQWPSWRAWYQHGRVLYKRKEYKDAIHAYQKSIALNPELAWEKCWDNLRECYDKTSDYIEGWHYYSRLAEEKPYTDWWQAWHCKGLMGYRMVKRFPDEIVKSSVDPTELHESIVNSFTRSIELHHDNQKWIWSSENLKGHLSSVTEIERGLQIFTDLSQRYPNYWILWHDRAWFEMKAKQHEKAVKSFLKATTKQPDGGWFWSWKHLGEIYLTQQNFSEAAKAFEMAIAQVSKINYGLGEGPNLWRAWRGKANALKQQEQYSDAITAYQEAISEAVKNNIKREEMYFSLGECQQLDGRICGAFESYTQTLLLNPNHAAAHESRAGILVVLRRDLLDFLEKRFNLDEVRTLCFRLYVNYDSLPGEGTLGKARELISNREKMSGKDYAPLRDLIAEIEKMRPGVPLP